METVINAWLSVWLYVMAAIGVILAIGVYKHRNKQSKLDMLCTFAIIVLILHVLEEWVSPGGLHYSYNISHGSMLLSCYPMNRLTDMITNFGGVIVGCIILKKWGFKKPAAIAVMLFSAFETVIHITIGIQDMHIFADYGMNTLYSPGLVTSLFGFMPVCIGLAKELFFSGEKLPSVKQWIMAIVGTVVLCFLLINLPEDLLGREDTPYGFTDRGYYEQFADEYESEHNLTYTE